MKKTPKKLVLTRETLHQLSADHAKAAFGGSIVIDKPLPLTTDSVKVCCA